MNAYADRIIFLIVKKNLLSSGRTYNYYEYENEVDNYQQDNYQLHFTHEFSKNNPKYCRALHQRTRIL